ncbi:hypothetical protein [Leuconostoc mesenteroides]|uniref:hypothetical protein n=1 Tax=Leuconostoc mesenteroides TaxID=1245 RepID=UPI0038876301
MQTKPKKWWRFFEIVTTKKEKKNSLMAEDKFEQAAIDKPKTEARKLICFKD